MVKSELRTQLIAILFATHPDEDLFFITSDDNAFTKENEHRAFAHALTLSNETIDEVHRDSSFTVQDDTTIKKQNPAPPVVDSKDSEKAAKAALKPEYVGLFGKNPAPQFDSAKIESLIAEEKARIVTEQAAKAADDAANQSASKETKEEENAQ